MKRFFLVILLFVSWTNALFAQADGTSWWNTDYNISEGTDFLVTFMRNSGSDESDTKDMLLYLYATARSDAKVTVTNPNLPSASISFTIPAGQQVKQKIDNSWAYIQIPQIISDLGIRVTSNVPISLYATSHHNSGKYDGTNVLPVQALMGSYVLQTYLNDQYATEFAIVASCDQDIDIHLIESTLDQNKFNSGKLVVTSVTKKDTTITMKAGQAYLYRSSTMMTSLSGTNICSTQPFALFQGGQSAKVPGDPENHIFHQSYSNDQWGKTFVVTPTYNSVYDYVRITATENGTTVRKNNKIVATLNAQETYQDTLNSKAIYASIQDMSADKVTWTPDIPIYTTSKAASCFIYSTGYTSNGASLEGTAITQNTLGAPTMSPIIPQEQAMRSNIFATFSDLTQSIKHYVNIVTLTSEVSGMRMDHKETKMVNGKQQTQTITQDISNQFKPVPSDSKYSYAILNVSGIAYTIKNIRSNVTSTFTARVYGLGKSSTTRESYAYTSGSRVNRSIDMLINNQYIREKTICITQTLDFTSIINFDYKNLQWVFGDGDVRTTKDVAKKKWDNPGDYDVSLIVTSKTPLCGNVIVDTVMAKIHVREEYFYNTKDSLCKGETYSISGKMEDGSTKTFSFNKDVDTTIAFKTTVGCDSIVHLKLKFGDPDPHTYTKTECGSYYWNGNKYTTSGTYYYTRTNKYGCETTDKLILTILKPVTGTTTDKTICSGDLPYKWGNKWITKAGTHKDTLKAANGCDSIITLNLKVEYSNKSENTIYICPGSSYQWRNKTFTEAKTYEEHTQTPAGCDSTFIFHIKHYPTYNKEDKKTICEGDYYDFGGDKLTKAGTYEHKFTSIHGCDSLVRLTLTVIPTEVITLTETICANHPYSFDGKSLTKSGTYTMGSQSSSGCGKTTILHLTVLPTSDKYDTITICPEQLPYTYASGKMANQAGDYTVTYKDGNQHGCDSTYHLHLKVYSEIKTNLPDVYQCAYDGAYSHPDNRAKNLQNLNKTGIYRDTLVSASGCDSILVLQFYWGDRTYYDMPVRVCEGELPWTDPNNKKLKLKGDTIYNDTIQNRMHCDSVITVHFSVAKAYTTTIDTTICEMQSPYNHPDKRLTKFQNLTKSGTYKQGIPTVDECDSTIILNLTINPTTYHYINVTECESNLPYHYGDHGKIAMADGQYRDTLKTLNSFHCDSILVVNLKILHTILDVQHDTICDCCLPYDHPDTRATQLQHLTTTGTYRDTLKSITGCDSVIELHLIVAHTYLDLKEEVELCDNEERAWNDLLLKGSWGHDTTIIDTLHTIYGCDSVITLTVHIWPTFRFIQTTTVCQDKEVPQWEWIDDKGGSHGTYPIDKVGTYTYTDHLYTIHHCDSIFGIELVVIPSYRFDSVYDICENEHIAWQNKTYSGDLDADKDLYDSILAPGTYYDTVSYLTRGDCDSIFYLVLHVHPIYEQTFPLQLCETELPYIIHYSDSYGSYVDSLVLDPSDVFPMITATQKGNLYKTFTKKLRSIHNCDSIINYDVQIHPAYEYITRAEICPGDYYAWWHDEESGRLDVFYSSPGIYYDSLKTAMYGCDSVYALELFIKPFVRYDIDTLICKNEVLKHTDTLSYPFLDRYTEDHFRVWQPGDRQYPYIDVTYLDAKGKCDSIVFRYYITYCDTFFHARNDTSCSDQPLIFNTEHDFNLNKYYSVDQYILPFDTIVYDTLYTINGCDSIFAINLHVYPTYRHIDTITICQNDTFTWDHGDTYYFNHGFTEAGEYVFWDSLLTMADPNVTCDSIYELRLQVNPIYHDENIIRLCREELPYHSGAVLLKENDFNPHVIIDTIINCDVTPIIKEYTYWDCDTTFSFSTINGCDSICSFRIEVYDTTSHVVVDTICETEIYTIDCGNGNHEFTDAGHYDVQDVNRWGCAHMIHVDLAIIPPTRYTLNLPDICLETGEIEIGYEYKGRPLDEYSVYFDSLGHSQGFEDIIHAPITDTMNHIITIPIPCGNELPLAGKPYLDSRVGINTFTYETKYSYPQPDTYPMRIVLHNGICQDPIQTKDTTIEMLYPAWIHEQHWNDGIVLYNEIYNGGYEFSAYQWYYNDQPIVGQVREFLYLPAQLNMNPRGLNPLDDCPNEYRVLLTRKSDGHQSFTCPICPVMMSDTIVPRDDYFSIVPTLVVKENPVVWILATMSGSYTVCRPDGVLIKQGTFVPDEKNYAGEIYLGTQQGYYMVTLNNDYGQVRTFKVLVK